MLWVSSMTLSNGVLNQISMFRLIRSLAKKKRRSVGMNDRAMKKSTSRVLKWEPTTFLFRSK